MGFREFGVWFVGLWCLIYGLVCFDFGLFGFWVGLWFGLIFCGYLDFGFY